MQATANTMADSGSYAANQYGPEPAAPPPAPNFFNLTFIRAFLWRQRLVLVGTILLALLIGLIVTLLMTEKYTATATLRIERGSAPILSGQAITDPEISSQDYGRYMSTLRSVLTSRAMAYQVVDALSLQNNAIAVAEVDGDRVAELGEEAATEVRRQIAASFLMNSVGVGVPMDSRVLSISFTSEDPVLSARVANAYVDIFLENDARQGAGANSYALSYLEEQIDDIRGQLEEAERQAINYARTNEIVAEPIDLPAPLAEAERSGTASTLSVTNLGNINSAYTSARANRIEAEQRWRAIANVPATELPEVQQSATVQGLRLEQAQLRTERSDLLARYREDFPLVLELDARIAEIDRHIANESALIKSSIRRAFEIAQGQERALAAERDRVSAETLDEQDRRVQYNIMDRDAAALRAQLASLLARYNDISAAANLRSGNINKIDPALVPSRPSSPDLMVNMIISLLMGVAVAGGLAILRETFDDRLRSVDEIERKVQLPALGKTPHVSEEIASEIGDPFSPISEAYASIRATLDLAVQRDRPVIQFTSSEAGEGKTTTALALGRKYASIGRKVLLADMDLRRPGLAKSLGAEKPERGVVDVLYSRVPIESALLPRAIENLDILPVGEIPSDPVEIMSSGLIAEFIERYRTQYDVILLDGAPVMGIADAPLLSRHVDGVVFVVEANRAKAGNVKNALRRLFDMDANVVGVVLTKFRALEAGEGYKSELHYYSYNSRTE